MKWLFLLMMVTITNMAAAQPGPPGPGRDGPGYGPPVWERDRIRPLSCEEWRRDARRHPCVRVPPRCRYR